MPISRQQLERALAEITEEDINRSAIRDADFAEADAIAQARLSRPRYLAPGIAYMGQTGNLDDVEDIEREIYRPLRRRWNVAEPKPVNDGPDTYHVGDSLVERQVDGSWRPVFQTAKPLPRTVTVKDPVTGTTREMTESEYAEYQNLKSSSASKRLPSDEERRLMDEYGKLFTKIKAGDEHWGPDIFGIGNRRGRLKALEMQLGIDEPTTSQVTTNSGLPKILSVRRR